MLNLNCYNIYSKSPSLKGNNELKNKTSVHGKFNNKILYNQVQNYYIPSIITFKGNRINNNEPLDFQKLNKLNIPNFRLIYNNNVRGESLSSKKNRKFLYPVKNSGIKNIIDLRDKYRNQKFEQMCEKIGLNYFNIPVDSDSVEDRNIIENLPKMFKILDEGNTYIACAQGLHRTDIALAINYIFNPNKQKNPPIMYGHQRDFGFKFDDISKRLNSLYKTITQEDLISLGWQDKDSFKQSFEERKNLLKEYNKSLMQVKK